MAVSERVDAALCSVDGALVGFNIDVIEDGLELAVDCRLMIGGDFGKYVSGPMDKAANRGVRCRSR